MIISCPSSVSVPFHTEASVLAAFHVIQHFLSVCTSGHGQHPVQSGRGRGETTTDPRHVVQFPGRGDGCRGARSGVPGAAHKTDGRRQQVEGLPGYERSPAKDWDTHWKSELRDMHNWKCIESAFEAYEYLVPFNPTMCWEKWNLVPTVPAICWEKWTPIPSTPAIIIKLHVST